MTVRSPLLPALIHFGIELPSGSQVRALVSPRAMPCRPAFAVA